MCLLKHAEETHHNSNLSALQKVLKPEKHVSEVAASEKQRGQNVLWMT